jgi:hypothetical protein
MVISGLTTCILACRLTIFEYDVRVTSPQDCPSSGVLSQPKPRAHDRDLNESDFIVTFHAEIIAGLVHIAICARFTSFIINTPGQA